MSTILEAPAVRTAPQSNKKDQAYSVRSIGDEAVMVQIEDIDLARALAKVKKVHRADYSDAGAFLCLNDTERR
jgi:hypothetical protein